jgi:hypothetical protein
VPAARANSTAGALILAPLSDCARPGRRVHRRRHGALDASGAVVRRTANPWNEQPAEKGEPPTGLV